MKKHLARWVGLAIEFPVLLFLFIKIGQFLDKKYDKSSLFVLFGIIIGFSIWIWHIYLLQKKDEKSNSLT